MLRSFLIKQIHSREIFLVCLLLVATCAFNQGWAVDQRNFHTWKAQDGLEESFSTDLSTSPDGKVWVRHGYVPNVTSFDGREFTRIPVPDKTMPVSIRGAELFEIREYPSGVVWGSRKDALYQYQDEAWNRYDLPPDLGDTYTFGPIDEHRVLLLTPDRLLEFNIETKASRVVKMVNDTVLKKFLALKYDRHSGYWITGEEGIAKLVFSLENPDVAEYDWEDFSVPNKAYKGFKELLIGWNDDIYVVALHKTTNVGTLLQFDGTAWKEIYGEVGLWGGWIDPDERLWIASGQSIYYFEDSTRSNPIAINFLGEVNNVVLSKNGVFWIATTQGLVGYFPPLWRTPLGLEARNLPTQSMCETTDGTLWFTFPTHLGAFSRGKWTLHPLPEGYGTFPIGPFGLCILPDGRIAFNPRALTYGLSSTIKSFMIFDPASETFEFTRSPYGEFMGISQSRDGSNIVRVGDGDDGYALESFDGAAFHTIAEKRDWGIGTLRSPFVARNGDIWMGGIGGLGLYRNGEYKKITEEDGFMEDGVFSIYELDNGDIWMGGRKRIVVFDGKEWSTIKEIGAIVRSITSSQNGDIWASSDVGLYRYSQGSWLQYTEEDGLPSSIVWAINEDSQGRIWCATDYGPSLLHPDADTSPPDTRIPSNLNSKNIPDGEPVNLVFEGVDQWIDTPSERLLFSYRLDEADWSPYSSASAIQVEDLTTGLHHVEVRAIDMNLNVDPAPAVFTFQVLPTPIQERPWFILSLFAVTTLMTMLVLAVSNARKKLAITVNSLEETVQIRTAELREDIAKREISEEKRKKLEQQLLQAQKMESIGTLAGGIAHDFNNILQAILGYSKLAQDNTNEDTELVDFCLQEIDKGGFRAADLVDQILTFSRKTDVKTENLNLPPLIREALKFIRSSIPSTIRIESDIDPNCAQVVANGTQIHQVVANLCTNSMHAMEEKGGTLSVALKPISLESSTETLSGQLEEGDYIQLSISDTGIGIDPVLMNEILDPFFTTKEVGKGTGLGLSMTHGIVRAIDGGLTIKSEVGKGTTVLITLPVATKSAVEEKSNNHPQPLIQSKGHIMVVDDEETITKFTTLILEKHGYTSDEFNDVASAIKAAKENSSKYTLAVLDYIMPSMTGIDLARELEVLIPGMPVLIATGMLDNSTVDQTDSQNIVEIIQKPYSSADLIEAINRGLIR